MVIVTTIELAWRTYLPSFFASSAGLSLGTAGALLMAARLFDSVIDPVIAWASDRLPTRYGHRRPWLVASLAPMMLGALGVFFLWPWTSLASLILASLLLHLGLMLMMTPHGGWALEIARSPAERLRVIGAKTWFGVAGIFAVLLLPAALERGLGVGREGQVAVLGLALLLMCPVIITLVVRYIPEPALPSAPAAGRGNPLRLIFGILGDLAMRPLLLLYMFAGLTESACSAAFFFLIDDALGLKGWASSLLLLQSGAMLLSLPLWSKYGERIGRQRLLALAYGWQIALAPFIFLLPSSQLAPAIGFVLLRGMFAGVDFLVLRTMVADVARNAATAGLRLGASCYAVSNVTLKLAMGAGAWLALSAIGVALGEGVVVNAAAGQAIRLVYACVPIVTGVLSLLILGAQLLTAGDRTAASVQAI